MQKTLMQGLNEKDMQAEINTYDLKPYYYPSLFPLTETPFLTWKMLEAQAGLKIAADLVSRGSTIGKKTRQAISRIQGDIPKISISREKLEDELTEYDIMIAMSSTNPDLQAIVKFWAEDTEFCWTGIAARAEWIALKEISLGKVKFTNQNNAGIVTEYDVDYALKSEQKIGVTADWGTTASAKPFSKDIPKALKAGKDLFGATYKFAFMNLSTLEKLVATDESVKLCASYLSNLAQMSQTPSLEDVNAMLLRKVAFKGLQIIAVDQDITIELPDGSRTTGNPFEDDVVLFSESKVLGKTYWKRPIDMNIQTDATKVMRGHTMIQKYSEVSPIKEVTEGISNLFPAWNLGGRSVLMQVNKTSWDK